MEKQGGLNVQKSLTQDINDGIETITLEYLQAFATAFEQTKNYQRSRDAASDVVTAILKSNRGGNES